MAYFTEEVNSCLVKMSLNLRGGSVKIGLTFLIKRLQSLVVVTKCKLALMVSAFVYVLFIKMKYILDKMVTGCATYFTRGGHVHKCRLPSGYLLWDTFYYAPRISEKNVVENVFQSILEVIDSNIMVKILNTLLHLTYTRRWYQELRLLT